MIAAARSNDPAFVELRDRRRRVAELCESQLAALQRFHHGNDLRQLERQRVTLSGFALNPADGTPSDNDGTPTDHLSISSTATCVRSLLASPSIGPNADYTAVLNGLQARADAKQLDTRGLEHGNVYTLGQLLPVLRRMVPEDSQAPTFVAWALGRLQQEIRHRGVRVEGQDFPANGFLTYWALAALDSWEKFDAGTAKPSLDWSQTELYRQLALFGAGDDEADPYQLGYNLFVQRRFQATLLKDSVLASALNCLFEALLPGGLWEKKEPLFRYGDQGDAHPFTFELLNAILTELRDAGEFLVPHEDKLERAVQWAARNAYGGERRLWRSGHLAHNKEPESWATAEVYCYLQNYRGFLAERILAEVRRRTGRGRSARAANAGVFAGLYQPLVKLGSEKLLLGDALVERMLKPLRVQGSQSFSLAHNPQRKKLPRSGIFFGPPGTGKTTYADAIARYLGWPLITITPADFAAEGLLLLPTVGRQLFDRLLEIEDAVIFFDEMEELIHKRDGDASFEQRFLTTSFLPSLQDLRDRASCIYIVATNNFQELDPAAQAPRRFDFQLAVLPPAFDQKMRLIDVEFGGSIPTEVQKAIEDRREKITWTTYSEIAVIAKQLAASPACAQQTLDKFEPSLFEKRSTWEKEEEHNAFHGLA
jgi:ATPase family associated with various cellular activities (AAA)